MEIENFDKTRVKFLVEIKREIFRFNSLGDTTLKVSRLLATSLEILVANTQFSLALATSWSQFRTLCIQMHTGAMPYSGANTRIVGLIVHSVERMESHMAVVCYGATRSYGIMSRVTLFFYPGGIMVLFFRCV